MNNVTVAVWGNNGAGKTSFSASLAFALTKYFRTVLLANADRFSPAFAVWGIPKTDDGRTVSIADIMTAPDITSDYLSKHITLSPVNDKIGLCGYLTTDDCELYEKIHGNAALSFLSAASELSQITIIDCTNPQEEALTEKALKCADIIITLIEPNAAGIGFIYAQNNFISHNFNDSRHYIFIASKTMPNSAVVEFEAKLGIHFLKNHLPFTEEARDKLTALELFKPYSGEYRETAEEAAEIIKEAADND